ncbi:MAG: PT domain-containing protein [Oscillospiraceae bacterium]|jgi:uncharacterized lipoprotein YehR (DUF1307 family)|nr:PT domain-containing protein [Oscillospiraceae bacterium]
MKKLLALLMALALTFALAACGNSQSDADTNPTEQTSNEPTAEPTAEPTPEPAEPTEAVVDMPVAEPSDEPEAVGSQLGTIQTGTWDETRKTFTNEWSGLQITLPDGFIAATDETIQLMLSAGGEIVANSGEGFDAGAALQTAAYDFVIQDAAYIGAPSLSLMYENVSANLLTAAISETDMLNMMAAQFALLESQGLTYTETERGTRVIADQEWTYAVFSLNDGLMTQLYALRKIDGAMANLTLTYTPDTEASGMSLIDALTAVK